MIYFNKLHRILEGVLFDFSVITAISYSCHILDRRRVYLCLLLSLSELYLYSDSPGDPKRNGTKRNGTKHQCMFFLGKKKHSRKWTQDTLWILMGFQWCGVFSRHAVAKEYHALSRLLDWSPHFIRRFNCRKRK